MGASPAIDMNNTTISKRETFHREPKYLDFGIRLPPEKVLDEFRGDAYAPRVYDGLCYAAVAEKMVFDDLHHGTSVIVVESLPHFRHMVRRQRYDFFIIKDAGADTFGVIGIIEKAYRQRKEKIPPISVFGQMDDTSREMLYLLQERLSLVPGTRKSLPDTLAHITTGLEAYLK